MDNQEKDIFGTLRLKKSTLQEYKEFKIRQENSIKKELTNDEFVKMLMELAMRGNK